MYSTTEVSKILGISARRIAVLCIVGRFLGAQKIGKTWVIPESAIRSYTPGTPGRPKSRNRIKDVLQEAGILPSSKNRR